MASVLSLSRLRTIFSFSRHLLVSLVFFWAVGSAFAQSVREVPLYLELTGKKMPVHEEVIYDSVEPADEGLNRVVTNISVPTLTIYRPEKKKELSPALVVCPGGGYGYVVIDREGHAIARHFQQLGFTVAVLKYRLPEAGVALDQMPRSQKDGLAAVGFLRARAAEWKLDPGKIGILGCSAGGHLAGSVAVFGRAESHNRPDFAVLLYPVVSMEAAWSHLGSRRRLLGDAPSGELQVRYSLERQVYPGMPPVFLVHAKDDRVASVENSLALGRALDVHGVASKQIILEEGGHGFGIGRDAGTRSWPASLVEWLHQLPRETSAGTRTNEANSSRTVLPVTAVLASAGTQKRAPSNAVDGNAGTSWAAEGNGQWLRLDLGKPHQVAAVEIEFPLSDRRMALFGIELSLDGSAWVQVFEGRSDGRSKGSELFSFAAQSARFVRYFGYGNSDNAWNTISEVKVIAAGNEGEAP